ncbi:hypothetical protein ACMC56_10775 [Campylobacterota bacterium DY0563]
MKFSKDIKTSFNIFSSLFTIPIGILVWVTSFPFAFSAMKLWLIMATFVTGYLFIKFSLRLPSKKEYLQMITFGTIIYISMSFLLLYKMHGLQFFKDTFNLIVKFDISVWLSIFMITLMIVLKIAFFFSNFILKPFLLSIHKKKYKKFMPFNSEDVINNLAKIATEDKGCDHSKHEKLKENLRSVTLLNSNGNQLLLAYGREILVLDNNDLSNPVLITKFSLDYYIDDMFILDSTTIVCYTAEYCGKIMLLNVSNLQDISLLTSYDIQRLNTLIKVNENMLACAYERTFVMLIDVSNRKKLKSLGEYNLNTSGGVVGDLFIHNDILICAHQFTKLDISNPKKIKFIENNKVSIDYYNFVQINDNTVGFCWRGDYGGGTFVLEKLPDFKHMGGYNVKYCLNSIIVLNKQTVAAINSGKIILLDISNDKNIELLSEFDIDKYELSGYKKIHKIVKINNSTLAYYGQNTLLYLDVTNRKQIREIGTSIDIGKMITNQRSQ